MFFRKYLNLIQFIKIKIRVTFSTLFWFSLIWCFNGTLVFPIPAQRIEAEKEKKEQKNYRKKKRPLDSHSDNKHNVIHSCHQQLLPIQRIPWLLNWKFTNACLQFLFILRSIRPKPLFKLLALLTTINNYIWIILSFFLAFLDREQWIIGW